MATKQEVDALNENLIHQLDPDVILTDDNTRYGLKKERIEALAASIVSEGGVIEPVEVQPLVAGSSNGHKFRLTLGFYRVAAVKHLNATQGSGLTVPAIIHDPGSVTDRLKRQLAENMERENQSPMDMARAIRKMLDNGMSRTDIRTVFGDRTGKKAKPKSNAWLNMLVSFLDLPKNMQAKIHDGTVGVGAAYQLTKVPVEKRNEVFQRVVAATESERERQSKQEEKDEDKFLKQESKLAKVNERLEKAQKSLDVAKTQSDKAMADYNEKSDKAKELYQASTTTGLAPKDRKAAQTAFNAAEKARIEAEGVTNKALEVTTRLQEALVKVEESVKERTTKLEAAKETKAKAATTTKTAPVGAAAVKAAAGTGTKQLNATEMRDVIKEMMLPAGHKTDKKLNAIGTAIAKCFAGETTIKQLIKEVEGLL